MLTADQAADVLKAAKNSRLGGLCRPLPADRHLYQEDQSASLGSGRTWIPEASR